MKLADLLHQLHLIRAVQQHRMSTLNCRAQPGLSNSKSTVGRTWYPGFQAKKNVNCSKPGKQMFNGWSSQEWNVWKYGSIPPFLLSNQFRNSCFHVLSRSWSRLAIKQLPTSIHSSGMHLDGKKRPKASNVQIWAWNGIPFQIQNREHREQIRTWALNREDPFWQSF